MCGLSPPERLVAIVSNSRIVPTSWKDRDSHVKGERHKVCGVGQQPDEYPFSRGFCVMSRRGVFLRGVNSGAAFVASAFFSSFKLCPGIEQLFHYW